MTELSRSTDKLRDKLIKSGRRAVEELIKVAEEPIVEFKKGEDLGLAADRLKNAAAAKKLAIFDAFEILDKLDAMEAKLNIVRAGKDGDNGGGGLVEGRF